MKCVFLCIHIVLYLHSNSLISTSSFPHASIHCMFLLLVNPGVRLGNSLIESFLSTVWAAKVEHVSGLFRLLLRKVFLSPSSTVSSITDSSLLLLVKESDDVSEWCNGSRLGGDVPLIPAEARLKQIMEVHPQQTLPFVEASWNSVLGSCLTNWYWIEARQHYGFFFVSATKD